MVRMISIAECFYKENHNMAFKDGPIWPYFRKRKGIDIPVCTNLAGNIGLAIGSALSFGILTWLTAEGIERMDNPDMPEAFRGAPSTLLFIGLLALALMGFVSNLTLI